LIADAATGFHLGLLVTTFWFGFRHGIDWDHLAALTDITGTQTSPRRSMGLATLYVLGHAMVVFALGLAAILLSDRLPASVDEVMGRIVGATLVVLGVYVLVSLVRDGRDFRLRSRWMLVLSAVRRLRRRPTDEVVIIEHDHDHAVDKTHGHVHVHVPVGGEAPADPEPEPHGHGAHRHVHHHIGRVPDDPFVGYGSRTAFGIGMLHGVGAETPTQVLVFLTAAGVGGRAAGVVLLVAFLVGLITSNTVVALAGTFGFLRATKHWSIYVTVSVVTAIASLVVGTVFLLGSDALLPAFFGG
jgi:high-affinity nickel-transport protein